MALILDVKNLKEGVSKEHFDLEAGDFDLDYEGIAIAGMISLDSEINRIKNQIVFKGHYSVPVRLTCARCAEEYEKVFSQDLMFVLNLISAESDSDLEDSEDYYFLPEGSSEFDMTPVVREQVILQAGLKPLCSEDCKGICPTCGVNRNRKSCKCEENKVDPRWIKLQELAKKQN